ncbi:uncharacterized protein CIMG_13548 [Coccidioides immitis RS]|uniref:Uncharacterized protein n=1 Tax=Coccidioides immitis (strain RS) TaxID=246410 RepID=A0A0E1S002_COCIM|nr:uncharacterized protein CIMG_13548 [Coccidioides immitis RS]EAS27523.2 hypothetical protein CIMG_13548 [Coccidioides immitis RS]
MHVNIHYLAQVNKYAILNNCNVLIKENKHQKYKKLIQKTNKQDIEKILLIQESFRHILLLLLEEAFINSKLFLIQYIFNLYKYCPTLFTDLLQLNINLHENEFEILNTEDKDITEALKCI